MSIKVLLSNAPVICIHGSPRAGVSGDKAGLKCQVLTWGYAGFLVLFTFPPIHGHIKSLYFNIYVLVVMGATIVPFSEKVAPITTRTFMVLIQFTNAHVHLHSEIQTPHFYSLELPAVVPHYCQPPGCQCF